MGRSRLLSALLLLAHAGALLITPLVLAPAWVRIALLASVVVSFVHSLREHGLRIGSAVSEIELSEEVCIVRRTDGPAQHCRIGGRFIHPWIVVLSLKPEEGWRRISVVIMRDALPAESFRVLRARLNFARLAA